MVSISTPAMRRVSICSKKSTQVGTLMKRGVVVMPVWPWKALNALRATALEAALPRMATVSLPVLLVLVTSGTAPGRPWAEARWPSNERMPGAAPSAAAVLRPAPSTARRDTVLSVSLSISLFLSLLIT